VAYNYVLQGFVSEQMHSQFITNSAISLLLASCILFVLLAKYSHLAKRNKLETNPNNYNTTDHSPLLYSSSKPPQQSKIDAFVALLFMNNEYVEKLLIFSIVLTLTSAGVGLMLVYTYGYASRDVVLYAEVWGLFAIMLLMVQYIPQIYTTHKNKASGSLSVATLLLQVPGSFAIVYFQAFLNHESWTTWAAYLCAGTQQLILLCQCTIYYLMKRRTAKRIEGRMIQ